MTPEQALEYIPDLYTQGVFYPADDGWEVAETWGRGRNHGRKYITARLTGAGLRRIAGRRLCGGERFCYSPQNYNGWSFGE